MKALVNAVLDRGLFEYQLKPFEIAWAVVQGVGAFIATTAIAPLNAQDWQTYAIALIAAGARAGVAVIFGKQPTAPVAGGE